MRVPGGRVVEGEGAVGVEGEDVGNDVGVFDDDDPTAFGAHHHPRRTHPAMTRDYVTPQFRFDATLQS